MMKTWIYKRIFSFCVKKKRALPKFLRRKIYIVALNKLQASTTIDINGKVREGCFMCPYIEIAAMSLLKEEYRCGIIFSPCLLPEFSREELSVFLRKKAYFADIWGYPLKGKVEWMPYTEFGYHLRLAYLYDCAIRCRYSL